MKREYVQRVKLNKSLIYFTISLVAFCFAMMPLTAIASDKLNLGLVESSTSKTIKRFKPLLEYLNSKGVSTGKVIVTKTISKMVEKFKAGDVDFMFESPYGVIEMMDQAGAEPILIREKKGVKEYNSVIFVPKDSPIKTFADLNGKVIAFEDPNSTSSFLLPKNILIQAGLQLTESPKPMAGKVSYYFSKDDDNTIIQVKAGKKAAAGGIKKSAVDGNADFRLLTPESEFVPRHVVLVRQGLDYTQLKNALLGAKDDPEAKAVLKTIKTPTGFSEFEGNPLEIMNTSVRNAMGL